MLAVRHLMMVAAVMIVGGVKVGWFFTAMVSVLCSALSKEQGITAVAVCMAYDALYTVKVCQTSTIGI